LKTKQTCLAEVREAYLIHPSSSRPGVHHIVKLTIRDPSAVTVTCSCEGFRFRGTCSHAMIRMERCNWDADNDTAQTDAQRDTMTCPRCGSRTVITMGRNA